MIVFISHARKIFDLSPPFACVSSFQIANSRGIILIMEQATLFLQNLKEEESFPYTGCIKKKVIEL